MALSKGLNRLMYEYYREAGIFGKTQFGELLMAGRTPIIELNSSYGTSNLRDIETTAGTGSITSSDGEIVLSTGATASSSAALESAEIGRYVPGYGAEIGIGMRFSTLPDGNKTAKWGGLSSDGNNGFYFGYDSNGLFVAYLRNSVETKIYQSNWNLDTLDGSAPSEYTLDITKGNIYQVQFTWYGYGQILFGVLGLVENRQTFIPCHQISNKEFASTSVLSPNLKVYADVENNGDAEDLTAYVGGRQYSIIGEYVPKYRFTGDWRGSVNTSTTVKPLISFQRKSAFNDRSIKLAGFDVIAATEPCIIEIRLDGSLTNESFGTPTNHTASETALESDKSATAITGGNILWTQLVPAGQNKNSAQLGQEQVDVDIPNGSIVSMCARSVSGTGTIISSFRMREEW